MSSSIEIVDAIQQLLDRDGSLSKIRATLRANVAEILSSKNGFSSQANKTQEFVRNQEHGKLSMAIVRDLLQSLGMTNSLKVFDAECGGGGSQPQYNRENLMKELSLPNSKESKTMYQMPILVEVLSHTKNSEMTRATIHRRLSPPKSMSPTQSEEKTSPPAVLPRARSPLEGMKGLGDRMGVSALSINSPPQLLGQEPSDNGDAKPVPLSVASKVAHRLPDVSLARKSPKNQLEPLPTSPTNAAVMSAQQLSPPLSEAPSDSMVPSRGGRVHLSSSSPAPAHPVQNEKLKEVLWNVSQHEHSLDLSLVGTVNSKHDVLEIAKVLGKMENLATLDLSNLGLSAEDLHILQSPLSKLSALRHFKINCNGSLGVAGANVLAKICQSLGALEELFISRTDVRREGAMLLTSTLASACPQLKDVDMSHNNITSGKEGDSDLSSLLAMMSNLEHVNLSHNQLTSIGSSLFSLPHLRSCRLDGNAGLPASLQHATMQELRMYHKGQHVPSPKTESKSSVGKGSPLEAAYAKADLEPIFQQDSLRKASDPLRKGESKVVEVHSRRMRSRGNNDGAAVSAGGAAMSRKTSGWDRSEMEDLEEGDDFVFDESNDDVQNLSMSSATSLEKSGSSLRRLEALDIGAAKGGSPKSSSAEGPLTSRSSPQINPKSSFSSSSSSPDDKKPLSGSGRVDVNEAELGSDDDDYGDDFEDAEFDEQSPRNTSLQSLSRTQSGFLSRKSSDTLDSSRQSEASELNESIEEEFSIETDSPSPVATKGRADPQISIPPIQSAKRTSSPTNWGSSRGTSTEGMLRDDLKSEKTVILQDMEASVASEDIDALHVSALDNSDSFSFSQDSAGGTNPIRRSRSPKTSRLSNKLMVTKEAISLSGSFDTSERSEALEFSVDERELSRSDALDDYDYTTNALPALRK